MPVPALDDLRARDADAGNEAAAAGQGVDGGSRHGGVGRCAALYTDEAWELTHDHVTALAELEVPAPQDPQRFQVWLQTGDETLDYRLAQQYYRACALRIQAGGDHGFQGFAEQLPAMLSFAGIGADLYQAIDFTAL